MKFWLSPQKSAGRYFRLYFHGSHAPELVRTSFCHPLVKSEINTNRGRSMGADRFEGSFTWSTAVQALSVLLLRTLSARDERDRILEGPRGSSASSLDDCLSKQPRWLCEMFGCDEEGRAVARRLLLRSNSGCKVGPTVRISVNRSFLDLSAISIFWDDKELLTTEEIQALCAQIGGNVHSRAESPEARVLSHATRKAAPFQKVRISPEHINLVKKLATGLKAEAVEMLKSTNIFNLQRLKTRFAFICRELRRSKLSNNPELLSPALNSEFSETHRLGYTETAADRPLRNLKEPLEVMMSGTMIGGLLIFRYLAQEKGLAINVRFNFASTVDIARQIRENNFVNPPDLCLLGIAPAMMMLNRTCLREYTPFMLMPRVSNRVVARAPEKSESDEPLSGEFFFSSDAPTSASLYFHALLENGSCDRRRIKRRHMEPHEVAEALSVPDSPARAVLWFPHYFLNHVFNDCAVLDHPGHEAANLETVLFARGLLCRNRNLAISLNVAIRDAWLALQTDKRLVEKLLNDLLMDPDYMKFLIRAGGLYHLPQWANFEQIPKDESTNFFA